MEGFLADIAPRSGLNRMLHLLSYMPVLPEVNQNAGVGLPRGHIYCQTKWAPQSPSTRNRIHPRARSATDFVGMHDVLSFEGLTVGGTGGALLLGTFFSLV